MKRKAFGLIFGLVVAVLALVVSLPQKVTYAANVEKTKTATFLINNNLPYEADVDAGVSTGYDEYLLGEKNVEPIKATANQGFQIVGWRVVFTDDVSKQYSTTRKLGEQTIENGEQIYSSTDFEITYQAAEFEQSFSVKYTLTYQDKNGDGYFDYSLLTFDQVVENVTIDPVFDFIYSNVDATQLLKLDNLGDSTKWQSVNIGEGQDLFFGESINENGTTKYSNSFLKTNEKYYYFGEVYCDDGTNTYYTLNYYQPNGSEASLTQKIELSRGRFRFNEQVNFTTNVAIDLEGLTSSTNVDVTGVKINIDEKTIELTQTGEASFALTKDEFNRTKTIQVAFKMQESKTQLAAIAVEYDKLYIASIVPTINNQPAGENQDFIFNALNVNVSSYYSVIEQNKKYFVKDASTAQNVVGFKLTANEKIANSGYDYYTFESLSSTYAPVSESINQNNLNLSQAIDQNFEVVVNYTPVLYTVNFKFVLYDATARKFRELDGNFNVEESLMLERGTTSETITKTDISNNVGYNFVGFVTEENTKNMMLNLGTAPAVTTTISIHKTKPTNKTVLMLFEEKYYTVSFKNINHINLNDGTKNIYPVASLAMDVDRDGNLTSSTLLNLNNANANLEFEKTVKIGDVLTFVATANQGFKFLGFGFDAATKIYDGNTFSITITQEFLSTYDNANTNIIDIFDFEDYQTYTVTFTLKGAFNSENIKILMADLSVEYNGTIYNKANQTDSIKYYEFGGEEAKLVVENLKMFEYLKLISTAKCIDSSSETPTYYLFNRFTENFQSNFSLVAVEDPNSKATSYQVKKDIEIFVIYSMPGLWLNVSVDNAAAYDLQQSIDLGKTYVLDTVDNTKIDFTTKELIPSRAYKLYLAASFASGYELKGYKFNEVEYLAKDLTNQYVFDFTTSNSTFVHTLEILTNLINYKLNVSYAYSVEDEPTALGSFDISMEKLNVQFEMPEGYYAGEVYFKNQLGMGKFSNAANTNNYSSNIYKYDFTSTELSDLIDSYGIKVDNVITLNMFIVYTQHTYTITVNYSLATSKGEYDNEVSFPNVTMLLNGQPVNSQVNNKSRMFFNIPYGAQIQIIADEINQQGMSPYGWIYDPQAGFSSNLTTLFINKLTANQIVEYKLNYNSYSIRIETHGNTKSPIVTIKNAYTKEITNKISRFDELTIDTNADRQNGWRFTSMYYYKSEFVTYPCTPEEFEQVKSTLYVYVDNQYILNTEEYQEGREYYQKVTTRVDFFSAFEPYTYSETYWNTDWKTLFVLAAGEFKRNNSKVYNANVKYYTYSNTVFKDPEFQISKYYAELDENNVYSIIFHVKYDYIEISYSVKAANIGSTDLNKGDLLLTPDDYANIEFSIIDSIGNESSLDSSSTVTIENYKLRIKINLKTIDISNIQFSLANGIELISAFVYDNTNGSLVIADRGNGKYVLEFYISDMLNNNCLSMDDSFNIFIYYQIKTKKLVLTTNVPENSTNTGFYKDSSSNSVIFSMSYERKYGFGSGAVSSRGSDRLFNELHFLGKEYISYGFINNYRDYNNYFIITGLKLYALKPASNYSRVNLANVKGDLIQTISIEDFEKYGISSISLESKSFDYRFIEDLYVELQVQPVLTINTQDNKFNFTFQCDQLGNGLEQSLTIGQNSTFHIQIADILKDYVNISYHKNIIKNNVTIGFENEESKLIDAGTYKVKLTFDGSGNWSWLSSLSYDKDLFVVISPKDLELKVNNETFNRKQPYEKEYVGKNNFIFTNIADLLKYVYFTDGSRTYSYSPTNENMSLNLSVLKATTTYTNGDAQVNSGMATEDGKYLNILLTNIGFGNTNFSLINSSLLFENAMKVNKREIILSGVKVYDKVYDGTDKAEYSIETTLQWNNIISGDEIYAPNIEDLVLTFAKGIDGKVPIGYNINVNIDATKALKGEDASNYKIKVNGTTANIYPYSVSKRIKDFGTIEVRNNKGLIGAAETTRHELAGLIPIDAKLKVDLVYADSPEYVELYSNISRYLNRNRNFVVGYRIMFENNNINTYLDNNLTLVLPNAERLTNVLMLTGNNSVELDYSQQGDQLIVDLSQTNYQPLTFVLIQQRVLLKQWQLILIISLGILLLLIIIIVFIIVRKRKKERYSVNDKI